MVTTITDLSPAIRDISSSFECGIKTGTGTPLKQEINIIIRPIHPDQIIFILNKDC